MRVLVTGGLGFIGRHVVEALVAADHEVRIVDCALPDAHRSRPSPPGDVDCRDVDLRDTAAVTEVVAGVDAVSHQAAMVGLGVDFADVTAYVAHNDLGTANLLAALHAVGFAGRFVLASSMVVYGEGRYRCPNHGLVRPGERDPVDLDLGRFEQRCPACRHDLVPEAVPESASCDPHNVYAATKLHQEHLVASYAREHPGTSAAFLRYHNVYGPHMPRDTPYAGVASIFRSSLERGEAPQVFEDGRQLRDFVHVSDVARANRLAIEHDVGGPLNVCSGEPHTVLEMAQAIARAYEVPVAGAGGVSSRHAQARPIAPVVVGGARPGDVRHVFASPDHAGAALGFRAEVGFAAGMAEFAHAPLRPST